MTGITKNKLGNFNLFGMFFLLILIIGCHRIGSTPPVKAPKFNILFISIDTLRADRLGCYGYSDVQTPNIDQLAKEGALFSQCYTPVPITLPAHTSMMTGQYPLSHGVRNNGTFLAPPELETLAEILKARGYQTSAFIGAFVLDRRFGLDQGFDLYNDYLKKDKTQPLLLYNERKAEDVVSEAQNWLTTHGSEPFFLFLHCFDPHAPYEPPEPFAAAYKGNPYDGEISYVDQMLGKLFTTLKNLDIWDKTLVILTSDHGEGLGEHGEKTHAIFIYDATMHVPLIFRYPAILPQNVEIDRQVSIIDIFPTILELVGAKERQFCQGESLMGLLQGKDQFSRTQFFCETYYPLYNHGWSPLEGLRTSEWVYIRAPRSELYNIREDRRQMTNLYAERQEVAKGLETEMKKLKKGLLASGQIQSKKMAMDQDTAQRLRSLGYVATVSSEPEEHAHPDLYPDPKDMISTLDFLNMATYYYSEGNIEKAIEQFRIVLKINPNDVFAHFVLGYIYDQQGETELAIREFSETLRLDPRYISAYNDLGTVYNRIGKYGKALEQFQKAIDLNPGYVEAVENMGVVYFGMKEYDQAMHYFQKALAMNPKSHKAYNNIGSVYLALGDYQKAKEYTEKAHEMDPSYIDAINNLGSVLISLGNFDPAIEKFKSLLELNPQHLEGRVNLVSAYIGKGMYQEAFKEIEKARQIDPNMPKIYSCLGTLYVRTGKFPEAIEQFKKVILLNPSAADSYYNLGIAYYQVGELEQAIKAYQESLRLNPANAAGHVNLGIAYFNQQKLAESVLEYQKALALDPQNLEAHINLGVVYYNQGKFDLAREIYLKAQEITPDNLQLHINLGMTYYALGFMEKAEEEYLKGLEISPACLEGLVNLAILSFNRGNYDLAVSQYQKAAKLHPENPLGYYGLGYCYLIQGLLDGAIEALQQAIQLKPDHTEAQVLLERALAIKSAQQ